MLNFDDDFRFWKIADPKIGAFEIRYKDLLIFSKINSYYWPHCTLVAKKCKMVYENKHMDMEENVKIVALNYRNMIKS